MNRLLHRTLPLFAVILFIAPLSAQGDSTAISGSFKGNGQDAKLAHAVAFKGDPYDGKATIEVILSEKAPSSDSSTGQMMTGKLGNCLILKITDDGKLIGTQVYHLTHDKKPFSSIGEIKLTEVKKSDTSIQGKLSTSGEKKFFSQLWQIELSFKAKRI